MPYIGTTVPEGWVLCDGRSLSTISGSAALIALVGTTAPNLQGMFLRGTGTSPMNNEPGPALKAMQGEELKSHQHSSGSLVNATNGVHNHRGTNDLLNKLVNYTGVNTATSVDNNLKQLDLINGTNIPDDGDHTHTISGSTGMTSGTETRPVNYGVNYIIKL
jgi:microcystin-dependent protein